MSIDWDKGPLIDGDEFSLEPSLRWFIERHYGLTDMAADYIAAYEAQIAKPATKYAPGMTKRTEICLSEEQDLEYEMRVALRNELLRDEYAMTLLPLIVGRAVESDTKDDPIRLAFDMADLCMKARKS